MFYITDELWIEEDTVSEKFILGSGPGGQHVNKNATAVLLRFDLYRAKTLPDTVRERLAKLAANRISEDGTLQIQVSQYRSQVRNREVAWERLAAWIRLAAQEPKTRKPTKPSRAAKARRVDKEKHRSQVKSLRRQKPSHDD